MNIVADENIPFASEAFSHFGSVRTISGRNMSPQDIADADLLLVRSVTQVDAALLANSSVKFVGSATIGVDHIDLDWLEEAGIGFANAPGCNAESAADYVLSSLLMLANQQSFDLRTRRVGIIGCGNVGSRVWKRLEGLGVECLINDPPLEENGSALTTFSSLEEINACDIVTAHVPLTKNGAYPTWHLIEQKFISNLKQGAILINAARGPVIDNQALKKCLQQRDDLTVILDTWEGEPEIDLELMKKVHIGTPHIAGYSLDGKLRGTKMIYDAACRHFNLTPQWQGVELPYPGISSITINDQLNLDHALEHAISNVYDVRRDHHDLSALSELPTEQRAAYFDTLRKEYPLRRECSAYDVCIPKPLPQLERELHALGFQVKLNS